MNEVDFTDLGFQERRDIQEWIAANPGILGQELLIVSKEFSGFDRTNERLDLMAVDVDGRLVVIELKRDDTGVDVHWQAIRYASYLHRADADGIVAMLATYTNVSESIARSALVQHLGSDDDLNALNNDQRIILVSHRFAPEVTSAALWLNEKAGDGDLITCIQLTPYQDPESHSLYIQANTIIPVPGVERYAIGVGDSSDDTRSAMPRSFSNRNDEITHFLRRAAELTLDNLPDELKPNRKSRWAGGNSTIRHFHMWYSHSPWGNWIMTYLVELTPSEGNWEASVGFANWSEAELEPRLVELTIFEDQIVEEGYCYVTRSIDALDEPSAAMLAETLQRFIEEINPVVTRFEDEHNQEDT